MAEPQGRQIDLNADLGEHDGEGYAADEALLGLVSSANIACGAHAGSHEVMRRTVAMAKALGVSVGAHPSYPDREGFGRRDLQIDSQELAASVSVQIEMLRRICNEAGARLVHVKPHGALYNRAVRDAVLARVLAQTIAAIDRELAVLCPSESELMKECAAAGLVPVNEGFIDRAYTSTGALVPRGTDGAIIHDPEAAAERAVKMVREGTVKAIDGTELTIAPRSLCVHGDSPNALETITQVRRRLAEAGVNVRAFA